MNVLTYHSHSFYFVSLTSSKSLKITNIIHEVNLNKLARTRKAYSSTNVKHAHETDITKFSPSFLDYSHKLIQKAKNRDQIVGLLHQDLFVRKLNSLKTQILTYFSIAQLDTV